MTLSASQQVSTFYLHCDSLSYYCVSAGEFSTEQRRWRNVAISGDFPGDDRWTAGVSGLAGMVGGQILHGKISTSHHSRLVVRRWHLTHWIPATEKLSEKLLFFNNAYFISNRLAIYGKCQRMLSTQLLISHCIDSRFYHSVFRYRPGDDVSKVVPNAVDGRQLTQWDGAVPYPVPQKAFYLPPERPAATVQQRAPAYWPLTGDQSSEWTADRFDHRLTTSHTGSGYDYIDSVY